MRVTTNNSHTSSEERKVRKPLMEKKRRARINESLEQLKNFLLECDPETATWRHGQRSNKLEKADILELTVKFIQNFHLRMQQNQNGLPSGSSWASGSSFPTHVAVPMNRTVGGQVFIGAPKQPSEQKCESDEEVWRPW